MYITITIILCSTNKNDNSPPMEVYQRILDGHVVFPHHFSKGIQDLTKRLLQPQPFLRLGNLNNGSEGIKNHRWFEMFDWEKLKSKELEPPIKPFVMNSLDASNFEEVPEIDLNELPPISDWNPNF